MIERITMTEGQAILEQQGPRLPEGGPVVTQDQKSDAIREWGAWAQEYKQPITGTMFGVIQKAIEGGMGPSSEALQSVQAAGNVLEERSSRSISQVDLELAKFAEESKLDSAPPPGEVVDLRWENWEDYGWSGEQRDKVGKTLKNALGELGMTEQRAMYATEILLLAGLTGEEAIAHLADPSVEGALDSLAKADPYSRRHSALDILQKVFGNAPRSSIRAIFPEGFYAEEADSEPTKAEELAWQLMLRGGSSLRKWGFDGEYPLLEVRGELLQEKEQKELSDAEKQQLIEDKKKGIKKRFANGKYYLNESNTNRWVRERMVYWDGENPQDVMNFMTQVGIKKQWSPISVEQMFTNEGSYFESEDGRTQYGGLSTQWRKETFLTTIFRMYQIEYQQIMTQEGKLIEKLMEIAIKNQMLKSTFKTNMLAVAATQPLNFTEGRKGKEEERVNDNVMGTAQIQMFLTYYYLSDFNKLQQILGPDSKFFTRDHMLKAIGTIEEKKSKQTGETGRWATIAFMDADSRNAFENAFDRHSGQVKDPDAFVKFINFFLSARPNGLVIAAVREAVRSAVGEKFDFTVEKKYGGYTPERIEILFQRMLAKEANGSADPALQRELKQAPAEIKDFILDKLWSLQNNPQEREKMLKEFFTDKDSLDLAELNMYSLTRISGAAARNDVAAGGGPGMHYDEQSKMMNFDDMCRKYAENGSAFGNVHTVGQLKKLIVPLFEGITNVEDVDILDAYGRPIMRPDKTGQLKPVRNKRTIIDLFEELNSLSNVQAPQEVGLRPEEKKARMKQFGQRYQNIAGRLAFDEYAMLDYYANHYNRGYAMFKRKVTGTEIDIEKYNRTDAMGGVIFVKSEFIKDVQEAVFKQVRYLVESGVIINYNEIIRGERLDPETGKKYWTDMTRAEDMFGYDLLNREEYWLRDENGKFIRNENGLNIIDVDRVQANQRLLYKQRVLLDLAADLYQHQVVNSTDPRFGHSYYLNVRNALKSIAGGLLTNETKKHGVHVLKTFLDSKDMQYFTDRALNGNILGLIDLGITGFHIKFVLSSLLSKKYTKDEKGLLEDALALFGKAVFAGAY